MEVSPARARLYRHGRRAGV